MRMSVEPAKLYDGLAGPPELNRKMTLKLLKLWAKLMMSSGAVEYKIRGSVMLRKRWSVPAPSISAASYKSLSMLVSTPDMSAIQYGTPSHRLTAMMANLAQNGSDIHGMASRPISFKYWLIGPNSPLNKLRKMSSATTAGT